MGLIKGIPPESLVFYRHIFAAIFMAKSRKIPSAAG
jgi:hypothetical protein